MARTWAADLMASLAFLTRVPMPLQTTPVPLAQAMRAFPIAGALIGAAGGLLLAGLALTGLPHLATAGLTLAAVAILTGGLHEDGFADMADGLGGGKDRDGMLAIMRDSRTGSYGVLALCLGLLVKAVCLADFAGLWWAVPVAVFAASGAFSRGLIVWLMASTPPARTDGLAASAGQPSAFASRAALIAGAGIALALIFAVAGLSTALIVTAAGALAAACVRFVALRQIGGHTGDICGGLQFAAETAMLAAAAATLP